LRSRFPRSGPGGPAQPLQASTLRPLAPELFCTTALLSFMLEQHFVVRSVLLPPHRQLQRALSLGAERARLLKELAAATYKTNHRLYLFLK
jgi:hypothetical protein